MWNLWIECEIFVKLMFLFSAMIRAQTFWKCLSYIKINYNFYFLYEQIIVLFRQSFITYRYNHFYKLHSLSTKLKVSGNMLLYFFEMDSFIRQNCCMIISRVKIFKTYFSSFKHFNYLSSFWIRINIVCSKPTTREQTLIL